MVKSNLKTMVSVRPLFTGMILLVGVCFDCVSGNPAYATSKMMADNRPAYGNQPFLIAPRQIQTLQEDALNGSGDAAIRLGNYYYLVKLSFAEGLYWTTIAAENGLSNGMYSLGFHLRYSHNVRDRIRARYWLRKAEQTGSPSTKALARSLLQEMDRGRQ